MLTEAFLYGIIRLINHQKNKMGYQKFSTLLARKKSNIVTQIFDLITYYGSIFPLRERTYIKELCEKNNNVYWFENDERDTVLAASIVDPNHIFKYKEHELLPIGHVVSKKPGSIEHVLPRILSEHKHTNLMVIVKDFIAESVQYTKYSVKKFNPLELLEHLPELARSKTNYFNVENEIFYEALIRREECVFIKFKDDLREELTKNIPFLAKKDYLLTELEEMIANGVPIPE
jgi:hypothetical protein